MNRFSTVLLIFIAALGIAIAATYIVKPGDTLSSIARQFNVTIADLKRVNNLTSDELRAGQTLTIPSGSGTTTTNVSSGRFKFVTVNGVTPGVSVKHRDSLIPGDPVLIRVSGVIAGEPIVSWGAETLVMTRDGEDWVGVGRELLGTKPKLIPLRVNTGAEIIASSLRLLPDPKAVQNVFMSSQVLSTLTNANREREYAVLNAAHAKSAKTPRVWTKPFAYPAAPRFTSPFGQARLYQRGGELNFHYGEDIAGRTGDPIKAVNDGTVEIAGQYAIRGGLTGINHGAGIVSLYFHQSQILVKVGQKVSRGQVIGRIGATGFVTGPHLHWEMRVRGEATDPRQWVDRLFPQ
jgi:murein DD-endopeptidase MepM/ murein hydrolase activator NlpD